VKQNFEVINKSIEGSFDRFQLQRDLVKPASTKP